MCLTFISISENYLHQVSVALIISSFMDQLFGLLQKMPILFSVIARGTTVLAKYASCAGNFTEVTEQILAKIPQNENSKLTYSHGR